MYIDRPDLQRAIKRALDSRKHMIIHGESGTGKTWLYKNALKRLQVPFFTVNMANADRFGSLDKAFTAFVENDLLEREVGRSTEYTAEIDATIASGGTTRSTDYERVEPEPFLQLLRHVYAAKQQTILVFDNFEQILDNAKLIKQTVNILALLDDETYAKYNVQIAIVGVPNDIRRYFSNIATVSTISNRLQEVPEVARLSVNQANELIQRGFNKLHYRLPNEQPVLELVRWLTDRIPQQIQELCLEIATEAEEGRVVSKEQIVKAIDNWTKTSLVINFNTISDLMNSRDTKIGRRNQTLFVLGKVEKEDFRPNDIESLLRSEFPFDTKDVTLNLSQVLSELSKGSNPLIRRTPRGDEYRFVQPTYRMCLRSILQKSPQGTIEKVDFKNIPSYLDNI